MTSRLLAVLLFAAAYGRAQNGVAQIDAAVAPLAQRVTAARADLVAASLDPEQRASLPARVEALRTAELALASARADAFAKLQATPDRLTPSQVSALSTPRRANTPARSSMPHVTAKQAAELLDLTAYLDPGTRAVTAARAELTAASLATPRDDGAIGAKAHVLAVAEIALANARSSAMGSLQSSPDKLDAEQLAWLAASGGVYGTGGFTEPEPMDFADHRGYISLFDGISLKDWDGNPRFWRVENGAIVGESTPGNPSGNTYIAYRGVIAKDFTLKFEMKVEGDGGSGLQYRSHTGIPWSRPIPGNVTANVGPVNLNWMMTGPQADFWPSRVYSGQFYSENTPMGIMAWRGQVVEGAGLGAKRLMGNIGDRAELGKLVKANDWNQYTVIARGGTFLHVVNGQLMAVMIDDDPASSNNQAGIFGIEIEALTKVSVRNIWLKKLN